jgi:hypothetical protein
MSKEYKEGKRHQETRLLFPPDAERKREGVTTSAGRLSAETVEGASLALESVDDIKRGDGLALGVLSVGDGVTDDVLQENLEDDASLLVDEARDTLDTTTTCETTDGGLGDTLDVVTKNLAVALGTTLSETLSSLAAARHDCECVLRVLSEVE